MRQHVSFRKRTARCRSTNASPRASAAACTARALVQAERRAARLLEQLLHALLPHGVRLVLGGDDAAVTTTASHSGASAFTRPPARKLRRRTCHTPQRARRSARRPRRASSSRSSGVSSTFAREAGSEHAFRSRTNVPVDEFVEGRPVDAAVRCERRDERDVAAGLHRRCCASQRRSPVRELRKRSRPNLRCLTTSSLVSRPFRPLALATADMALSLLLLAAPALVLDGSISRRQLATAAAAAVGTLPFARSRRAGGRRRRLRLARPARLPGGDRRAGVGADDARRSAPNSSARPREGGGANIEPRVAANDEEFIDAGNCSMIEQFGGTRCRTARARRSSSNCTSSRRTSSARTRGWPSCSRQQSDAAREPEARGHED